MDELLNTLENAELDQKLALFPQLLEQGEIGVNYLINCLSDRELAIRAKAYELLENNSSHQVQQALAPGILFNPGDRVYRICRSTIYFNDSFYNLYQSSKKDKTKHLSTDRDYQEQGYKIISFDEIAYVATTDLYCINYQQAELAANQLNNQIISQFSITDFEINDNQTLIKNWCNKHQIIQKIEALQSERNKQLGIEKWRKKLGIAYDSNELDIYWATVEQYLKSVSNFELLDRLWQDLIGNITLIQEITFDKPTYLKIDPYYSQIFAHTNDLVYMDREEFLTPEEAETNLLLKALNNSKLEIRILAYKLLQGINLEIARQAIYSGVKLNPGDKIYSVYQSGMWFDDVNYNIYDERYLIDYLDDLNYQIYGKKYMSEEEERIKCKRIYCYVDKEQAEQKAEALHREMIQKAGIGIGGFEWRKENPKFKAKQWCIEHNIPYPHVESRNLYIDDYQVIWQIKELIWKTGNESLEDDFRRSRYIYHPKHIDTWCNDNLIDYDSNLDNWGNYRKVLDYLYLPENINLLSKFWKDGVGHLAFVKEEIVQEQIYIKIEENLKDLTKTEKSKLQLALKPVNYPELASKYLINIIKNDRASAKEKLKAQELLQNLDIDREEAKEAVEKKITINSIQDLGESIEIDNFNVNENDIPF